MRNLILFILCLTLFSCSKDKYFLSRVKKNQPRFNSEFVESSWGKVIKVQDQCSSDWGSPIIIELDRYSQFAKSGKVAAFGVLPDSMMALIAQGKDIRFSYTVLTDNKWYNTYCNDYVKLPPKVWITDFFVMP